MSDDMKSVKRSVDDLYVATLNAQSEIISKLERIIVLLESVDKKIGKKGDSLP